MLRAANASPVLRLTAHALRTALAAIPLVDEDQARCFRRMQLPDYQFLRGTMWVVSSSR